MLHVLENVRTTASGASSPTRSSADQGANWAYASSTTTRPGAASMTARTADGSSTRPVGLFGEHRNVTAGAASPMTSRAASTSSEKSSRRSPSTTVAPGDPGDVPVQLVRRLERDDRPDPARHRSAAASAAPRSTRSPRTPARGAHRATGRWPHAAGGRPVRVAVPLDRRHRLGQLVSPRLGRRQRRLVGVQPDVDVDLEGVVALERPQVGTDRHRVRSGGHGWRRYRQGANVAA